MTTSEQSVVRVALAQVAAVMHDRDRTIAAMEPWVRRAAADGAALVVFPESHVPGFPVWASVLAPVDQHALRRELVQEAVEVPGPACDALGAMAREHQVHLSVGVTETVPAHGGGLFNSNLVFGPDGVLVHHHRKLVPTWSEKLVWGRGDARALRPVPTDVGRLGVLVCGENSNPLARYALIAQGEQVHLAPHPPCWPIGRQEEGQYDIARAMQLRASAHAFEGKLFSLACGAALGDDVVERIASIDPSAAAVVERAPRARSVVAGPGGDLVAGPCPEGEQLLVADLDLGALVVPRGVHDLAGHYQRPELLQLTVDRRPHDPARFIDPAPVQP